MALATFNGARFVQAQLESIATQTMPPDEIVVSDDASTDDTLAVVRDFARRASIPVNILANTDRAGVNRNFERAIAATTGDVIFLADQDDVWAVNKVEQLTTALTSPSAVGVFTDASLIGERSEPLGRTLFETGPFRISEQREVQAGRSFAALLRWNFVTGATFAFRSSLKPLILPIPGAGLHDAWIALIASVAGELILLQEPLIAYRIHASNAQGVPARNPLRVLARRRRLPEFRSDEIALFEAAAERLSAAGVLDAAQAEALRAKLAHLEHRSRLPASRFRRAAAVVRRAPDYWRYARGLRSLVYDIVYG